MAFKFGGLRTLEYVLIAVLALIVVAVIVFFLFQRYGHKMLDPLKTMLGMETQVQRQERLKMQRLKRRLKKRDIGIQTNLIKNVNNNNAHGNNYSRQDTTPSVVGIKVNAAACDAEFDHLFGDMFDDDLTRFRRATPGGVRGRHRGGQRKFPDFHRKSTVSVRSLAESWDGWANSIEMGGSGRPPSRLVRALSSASLDMSTALMVDLEKGLPPIQIEIGLHYIVETQRLEIVVIKAFEVGTRAGIDFSASDLSECYIRLAITKLEMPICRTTTVEKSAKTVNFMQRFKFQVPHLLLPRGILHLEFNTYGRVAPHTTLGVYDLALSQFRMTSPTRLLVGLNDTSHRRDPDSAVVGELMVSLSYLPAAERLGIVLTRIRNVTFPSRASKSCIQVKAFVFFKNLLVAKKKTAPVDNAEAASSKLSEALVFIVHPSELVHVEVRLLVIELTKNSDNGKPTCQTPIGHVIVGGQTSGLQLTHWKQMLANPRKPAPMWQPLVACPPTMKSKKAMKRNQETEDELDGDEEGKEKDAGGEESDPLFGDRNV